MAMMERIQEWLRRKGVIAYKSGPEVIDQPLRTDHTEPPCWCGSQGALAYDATDGVYWYRDVPRKD